jgi:hypothetical protein
MAEPLIEYKRIPGYNLEIYPEGEVEIYNEGIESRRTGAVGDREKAKLEKMLEDIEENQLPFWKKLLGYSKVEYGEKEIEWVLGKPEGLQAVVEKLDELADPEPQELYDNNSLEEHSSIF